MKKLLRTSLGLPLFFAASIANAGLVVVDGASDTELSQQIAGNGISITSSAIVGAAQSFGTFSGGMSAGIGFESGIMLSTGNVGDAVGPNSSDDTSTPFGNAGSSMLNALLPSGQSTKDAAIFSFDFESVGENLSFNYVFASEEYNEYVDQEYNDIFAFFIDGVNIATLPDGGVVSIDSVNNNVNSSLYNDNETKIFDIEYDGFTDVFSAQFLGLGAGEHTITLVIADVGDSSLDSTVFIAANSFSSPIPTSEIPEPSILALFGLGLLFMRRVMH